MAEVRLTGGQVQGVWLGVVRKRRGWAFIHRRIVGEALSSAGVRSLAQRTRQCRGWALVGTLIALIGDRSKDWRREFGSE